MSERISTTLELVGASTFIDGLRQSGQAVDDLVSKLGGVSGQLGTFKSATDSAATSITKVGTETKTANDSITNSGTAASASAGKLNDLGTAATTAASNEKKLGDAATSAKSGVDGVAKAADGAKSSISAEGNEASNAATKEKILGDSAISATTGVKSLGDAAETTGKKTKDMGDSASPMSKVMDTVKERTGQAKEELIDLAKEGGEKLLEVGADSVKLAGDYQENMNRVKFLTGATTEEMDGYNKAAINIGMTTTFSSGQAAVALAGLAQQGIKGKEAIDLLGTAANAAMTNNTDLTTATTQLTTVVKAMGQPLSQSGHDLDVMTRASQLGKIQFSDFSNILSRVGGPAENAGQSFEGMTAAILSMTNTGISANQAANQLKGIITGLEKPNQTAAKAINELGLSVYDSTGKMRPLADITEQLQQKTAGLTQEQKNYYLAAIFGRGNLVGITAMMNAQAEGAEKGAGSLRNWTKALENSDGTAKKAADTIMTGFNAAFKNMQGSLEEAQITLGTSLLPSLTSLVQSVTGIINNFIEWEQETHTVGHILDGLGQVAKLAFGVVEGAIKIVGGALAPVVDGIGKLAQGIDHLAANNGGLGNTVNQFAFLAANVDKLEGSKVADYLRTTGNEFAQVGDKIYDVNGQVVANIQHNETAAQAVDRYRATTALLNKVVAEESAQHANTQSIETHRQRLENLESQIEKTGAGLEDFQKAAGDGQSIETTYAGGLQDMADKADNDRRALDEVTNSVNKLTGTLNEDQKALSTANQLMNNLKDAANGEAPAIQKAYEEFQKYTIEANNGGQGAEAARAKAAELRQELEGAHNPAVGKAADAFAIEASKAADAKRAITDHTVALVNNKNAQDDLTKATNDDSHAFAEAQKTLSKHGESLREVTKVNGETKKATDDLTGSLNNNASASNTAGGAASNAGSNFTTAAGNIDSTKKALDGYNSTKVAEKDATDGGTFGSTKSAVDGATGAIHDYNNTGVANKTASTNANVVKSLWDEAAAAIVRYNNTPVASKNASVPSSYAEGTSNHPGGPATVGEAGPELVMLPNGRSFLANSFMYISDLPAGSKVLDSASTRRRVVSVANSTIANAWYNNTSNISNNYNLNVTSQANSAGLAADFGTMAALAGASF